MIDYDDADDILWIGGGTICLAIAMLCFFIATRNEKECNDTKTCPQGAVMRLQNHECQCVIAPLEKEATK